ncbi:hypothetical protein [Streptomyces sp. CBMA156]|uniref:hypothetical protein n=1 Tax=Streptomyces sp. CBMA156 TaxID=1930280 RepID=UPI001661AA9C|nr:hypothetical protein [Streptomyces sp. CBMA156]MBD0673973.1 hypothetical protein [Streptomyces sp. CBMA156]
MDGAVVKVSAALCDARNVFDALDGSTPTGTRAVELVSAAYAEAETVARSATGAVSAARAWLVETNGDDARGCASWRRAIVLAGEHVKVAGEALAAPIIEEAQEWLNAREAEWLRWLAESGHEPSARGYAGLIKMFADSSRAWCAWFDGHTDYDGVTHAGHGDPLRSFVAQYDAWGKSKHSDRSVYFPSRYTSASLMAGDCVDAAAVAFTLAVADQIEGCGAEALRKAAAAVRKNPRGLAPATTASTWPAGPSTRTTALGSRPALRSTPLSSGRHSPPPRLHTRAIRTSNMPCTGTHTMTASVRRLGPGPIVPGWLNATRPGQSARRPDERRLCGRRRWSG